MNSLRRHSQRHSHAFGLSNVSHVPIVCTSLHNCYGLLRIVMLHEFTTGKVGAPRKQFLISWSAPITTISLASFAGVLRLNTSKDCYINLHHFSKPIVYQCEVLTTSFTISLSLFLSLSDSLSLSLPSLFYSILLCSISVFHCFSIFFLFFSLGFPHSLSLPRTSNIVAANLPGSSKASASQLLRPICPGNSASTSPVTSCHLLQFEALGIDPTFPQADFHIFNFSPQ